MGTELTVTDRRQHVASAAEVRARAQSVKDVGDSAASERVNAGGREGRLHRSCGAHVQLCGVLQILTRDGTGKV